MTLPHHTSEIGHVKTGICVLVLFEEHLLRKLPMDEIQQQCTCIYTITLVRRYHFCHIFSLWSKRLQSEGTICFHCFQVCLSAIVTDYLQHHLKQPRNKKDKVKRQKWKANSEFWNLWIRMRIVSLSGKKKKEGDCFSRTGWDYGWYGTITTIIETHL